MVIKVHIATFYLDDAFPKDENHFRKPMMFDDFIGHLEQMKHEFEEAGYSNITCTCKSDWDQPDWLVIHGERPETEEEERARIDKEKKAADKAEAKRQDRIRKLEEELEKRLGRKVGK